MCIRDRTISDSTVVTGEHNVVQQGKYNINIGSVQGLMIGDQAQVSQIFGASLPASPAQGSVSSQRPPSGGAAKGHLRQQLTELQTKYETLSNRVAALDKDLGRAVDSEQKLMLTERRQDLVTERSRVADEMIRIEEQLGV